MSRRHFFQVAGLAVIIAIWALSLLPGPDLPDVPGGDKWHHSLAYFACMFCWGQAYHLPLPRLKLAIAFIAMGVLIECLQSLTATRAFEFMDMVANAIGVIAAWFVVTIHGAIARRAARDMPGSPPPD